MKFMSIHTRILIAAIIPAITAVFLLGFYFVRSQLNSLDEALSQRGRAIANQLSYAAEYGAFSGNTQILQHLAESPLQESDVTSVIISRLDGTVLAEARSSLFDSEKASNIIYFEKAITSHNLRVGDFEQPEKHLDQITLGTVTVGISRLPTLQSKQRIFITGLAISLLASIMGMGFALGISRSVSRPLIKLSQAARHISQGKLNTRIDSASSGELGELERDFNSMAATIEDTQKNLQSQVDTATRELRETLEAVEIQNVKLDLARKRAMEVSREKTAFLANMSHEIRTPMNGLLGFIDLLLRTPLNAEQRDYTSTIRKSASNLLTIVNDILDFSKIESGKLIIESRPFDLREAMEDAVDLMAPVAHNKNLELVSLIYSDVPLHLVGDPNRLRQVLLNLIGNAIKFTEQGSVIIRVMLDENTPTKEHHTAIRISVSDSGIGLNKQQQKKLFQAFTQLDSSPSKQHGGTGLGLFISKNIVEAMNGKIGVESTPGEGSTFWISLNLPLQRDLLPLEEDNKLIEPATAIIYDIHPMSRLALRHPLEAWGLQVDEATNHEELISLAGASKHDIILVGLSIDHRHADSSRALLTSLTKFQIPMIVLLNEIDRDRLNEWCQAGATACLTKPTRRETLRNAIWKILQLPDDENGHFVERRKSPRPAMPNLTGANILLADDNEINRKLTTLQLETLGVNVDSASNGIEAISLANQKHYDLILMDLHMPGMSGDTAACKIRQQCAFNRLTPIIAITANIFSGESSSLSDQGINDCLIKPISESSLWGVIKRWVGRNIQEGPAAIEEDTPPSNTHSKILKDLLQMLVKDLPEQRLSIAQSFESQDWKSLREHAHKLNGSAAYCQATELQQAAAELEQAAFSEDIPRIETAYIHCNRQMEELINR